MIAGSSVNSEQIAAVREFNRFYTARLGLLSKRHLDGRFSLTEGRILYEVGAKPLITASVLRRTLELDAGYMSRVLAALIRKKLVRRVSSEADGREKPLALTATGEKAVARLNEQSTEQIEKLLINVTSNDRQALVASLGKVRMLLNERQNAAIRVERITIFSDEAHAILEEYYDAVHVVQRDRPGSIEKTLKERGSGLWLAYQNDEVVGCVMLRRLASIPRASECKRLYVKPAARGNRISDALLDAQEEYTRNQAIEWIYLDSYDDLKAAIHLYERRGYQLCERYNDNPQATLFMRKRITR